MMRSCVKVVSESCHKQVVPETCPSDELTPMAKHDQLKRYIKQVKIDILTMLADFNSAILSCPSY